MLVRALRTIHVQSGTVKENNVKTAVIPKGKTFDTGHATIDEAKAKRMLANRQLEAADRDLVDLTGTLGEDKRDAGEGRRAIGPEGEDKRDAGDGRPVGKASASGPETGKTVK